MVNSGRCLTVMKTAQALIAVIACSFYLAAPAVADGWKTLAGFNDSLILKEGETAFIVTVSDRLTVQYTKRNQRPVQFELTSERNPYYSQTSSYGRRVVAPTTANPFPLVGPAKITLKTSGVATMKVAGEPKK